LGEHFSPNVAGYIYENRAILIAQNKSYLYVLVSKFEVGAHKKGEDANEK